MESLGADSYWIWPRQEALTLMSRGQISAQLYDGNWRRPFPNVFADGGARLSSVQWAMAAVKASGGVDVPRLLECESPALLGAVACMREAARVWGVPLVDDDDPATDAHDHLQHDVAVWRQLDAVTSVPLLPDDPPDVLHRHQLDLAPWDVIRLPGGLWLTVPVRTLYDLTSVLSHEALVCAIDWCLHNEVVSAADLDEMVVRTKGWRHAPAFRQAVADSDGRAESPHESLTRLLLKPGWPELEPQVVLADRFDNVIARFDHADEEIKLAVESDSRTWHGGEAGAARDHGRDRTTGGWGWWTERVTWFQVRRRPEETRARVYAHRDRRRAQLPRAA